MTKKLKERYFSLFEILLLTVSVITVLGCFLIWDRVNYIRLMASLLGVFALILCAKGNPIGQIFIIIFSILYAIESWQYGYYGEMLTYLLMCLPMAVFSLISWLKNPFGGSKYQVKVRRIKKQEFLIILSITVVVTIAFYFILKYFNTTNLLVSTFSVATSFFAAALTFRRSPYFALFYSLNDVVLIILWSLALSDSVSYVSMIICFTTFLFSDLYGFVSWIRMEKRQSSIKND